MQAEKFVFMVDVSGSTSGSHNYWSTVREVYNLYLNNISHYYYWGAGIKQLTKKQMKNHIQSKVGKGGTKPQIVARQIIQNKFKNIILITDGQVGDANVKQCDKILENYRMSHVICYIIASKEESLNMSVTCPFTRYCEAQIYQKPIKSELKKLAHQKAQDFQILNRLDKITIDKFLTNYEKIQGLIIALNMGKSGDIPLKNRLVQMKNNFIKYLSREKAKKDSEQSISDQLRYYLDKGDFQKGIHLARKITQEYFSDFQIVDLQKKISHLINLCGDLTGKYDLDQIKSNKMEYALDAKQKKIDKNVQVHELTKNLIQCPIIMDDDVPQILVDQCQPILLGIQKFIVDDITSCPLRILNYPEVKAKLKSRLSNFIGVKYGDKFLKNPFTQRKLLGSIPLGCHQSHVGVGNYTIAKMFSDGKILGNLNLFYAAIWFIIKEKQIQYLKEIEANLTQHLVYRLKKSKTMASLCGLSQFVTTELTTDLAVWYCVSSGYLNQPADRDTFRLHLFNMDPLIDICKVFGYPFDKGIYDHIDRTKALISSLNWFKKLNSDEKTSFKQSIRCLYQNSIEINTQEISEEVGKLEKVIKFIPIDGESSKEQIEKIIKYFPKELQKLPLQEMAYIANILDSQKQASDYTIQYNFKCPEMEKAKIKWSYGLKPDDEFQNIQSKICPDTFRLFSMYGDQNWQDYVYKKTKISSNRLFKGRKYFELFLFKYKKIPTCSELLVFYYNRYVSSMKNQVILPFQTQIWAKSFIKDYTLVMQQRKLTINQILQRLEKSRDRKIRFDMEKKWLNN